MARTIFLSHNARDKPLADVISYTLRRISIEQIRPWFSSDDKADGGFSAGDFWYMEILRKIEKCNVLIAILTPNSVDRPWLYYEAGIAKGLNKVVVPVCIGLKREDIRSPLNAFQAYQLTDKNSLEEFLGKILGLLGFPLDKENFKKPIEEALMKLTDHVFEKTSTTTTNIEDLFDNLRSYIDQKFASQSTNRNETRIKEEAVNNLETYSIRFKLNFPQDKREFITEVADNDTFQDVTNSIFFFFKDILKPFTYLEEWIIIDNKTKNRLVVREIASRVPAKYILPKNRDYTIEKLIKPYVSTDSKLRI
jgi:hypothetical protein